MRNSESTQSIPLTLASRGAKVRTFDDEMAEFLKAENARLGEGPSKLPVLPPDKNWMNVHATAPQVAIDRY